MKPNPRTAEHFQEAMKALYDTTPVTDEDRAEHARLVAREYARREAAAEVKQLPLVVS